MDKERIEELNDYKTEYNMLTQRVYNCSNSIKTFQAFKNYFYACNKKASLNRYFSLAICGLTSALSIAIIPFSIPLAAIVFAVTLFSAERSIFLTKLIKKFKHCSNYLQRLLNSLGEKQTLNFDKSQLIMEKIKSLSYQIEQEKKLSQKASSQTNKTEQISHTI